MRMVRQAVILCGGVGSRLGALTAETPKPLLPVGGTPFLDVLLFELGRRIGIVAPTLETDEPLAPIRSGSLRAVSSTISVGSGST
jgi:dTDP-glucose pyrophosphorylase